MNELSINNIIRVTVQGVQRSIGVKNVNEVALFTLNLPTLSDPVLIALTRLPYKGFGQTL